MSEGSPSRSTKNASKFPLPPPPKLGVALPSAPPSANSMTLPPPPPPPPPRRTTNKEKELEVGAIAMSQTTSAVEKTTASETPARTSMPPRLPYDTFHSSNHNPLLAHRQQHFNVLVISTESAQHFSQKNGLQLVDLLQGIFSAALTTKNTQQLPPIRSTTKTLYLDWGDLPLQFVDEVPTESMSDADALSLLQQQATLQPQDGNLEQEMQILEEQVDDLLQEDAAGDQHTSVLDYQQTRQARLRQVTKDAYQLTAAYDPQQPLIPWLQRYRQALDRTTDHHVADYFATPCMVLLVCTTNESLPLFEVLRDLQSIHNLPPAYRSGRLDAALMHHEALVLHDNIHGPPLTDETRLVQDLRSQFGPGATLLRTNSIPPSTAAQLAEEERSDIWKGNGRLGTCLSVSDRVALRNYLQGLVSTSLVPALERRINRLNAIVSERKKGVRNALKSLWRAGATTATATVEPTKNDGDEYRFDAIESQARLLADTLFLLQDYEAAYATYRLIRDDFKQDKAMLYYGNVQEMMALCLYHLDPYPRAREIFSLVEGALLGYSRTAEPPLGGRPNAPSIGTRLASRLCLLLMQMDILTEERNLEVADLLASASSNETAIGAAVLLEQASTQYYVAGMYRKYAFHMLMSGHMFRTAGQDQHAFRCFTSALYIYRDGNWDSLHNHLRSALAAQLYTLGRMATALQLYSALVGSGARVSTKSQQKFLDHLFEICRDYPKKALVSADRMAASSKLTPGERDDFRVRRLDRIVQVVKYTKSASRVLELPHVGLPRIRNKNVRVLTNEEVEASEESVVGFGTICRGDDDVWKDLSLIATAELDALDHTKARNDEVTSRLLSKISDKNIQAVIAGIDKEKANIEMVERSKQRPTYKQKPQVRAVYEPITVEFTMENPLGLALEIADIQLVAKMTESSGDGRTCTSEDAIRITPLASYDKKRTWDFQGATQQFHSAEFCRVSDPSRGAEKQAWKSAEDINPFFVVTKKSLTLEPEGSIKVLSSVVPLVQGEIEVVGVRWMVAGAVWAYHPFELKGPLLQNSIENRANRIRGESMALKALIGPAMPCLAMDLVRCGSSEGPFLEGQIQRWNMRLRNVGTSPAKSITLKTNFPWLRLVPESEEPFEKELGAVKGCIGVSGTLVELPVHGAGLETQGQLNPSESIDILVDIRIQGNGRKKFYFLFRYEIVSSLSDDSAGQTRWLRKAFDVPVYPSLQLSASVIQACSTRPEYVLSVELTNHRTDRPDDLDLLLETVSLVSRTYSITSLDDQLYEAVKDLGRLGWQERVTMHYLLSAVDDGDECMTRTSSLSSAPSLPQRASETSELAFASLERAFEEFSSILHGHRKALARAKAMQDSEDNQPRSIASIRRANTSNVSESSGISDDEWAVPHASSIDKLCPATQKLEKVHLFAKWRTGETPGAHFIRDLTVRAQEKESGCPIEISAQYPPVWRREKTHAAVPVEVVLRNRLVDPVNFRFSMKNNREFIFTGYESFRASLKGGESLKLPFEALMVDAGLYNLQRVCLSVIREDKETSYVFPQQWLVNIVEQE